MALLPFLTFLLLSSVVKLSADGVVDVDDVVDDLVDDVDDDDVTVVSSSGSATYGFPRSYSFSYITPDGSARYEAQHNGYTEGGYKYFTPGGGVSAMRYSHGNPHGGVYAGVDAVGRSVVITPGASAKSYSFSYATPDGQKRYEYSKPGGGVNGGYEYRSPDGTLVAVRYTADEHGFRTVNDFGHGTPVGVPAPVPVVPAVVPVVPATGRSVVAVPVPPVPVAVASPKSSSYAFSAFPAYRPPATSAYYYSTYPTYHRPAPVSYHYSTYPTAVPSYVPSASYYSVGDAHGTAQRYYGALQNYYHGAPFGTAGSYRASPEKGYRY